MKSRKCVRAAVWLGLIFTVTCACAQKPTIDLSPSKMKKLGTVNPRYLSYNVEMVEVTGGRFWKPYNAAVNPEAPKLPNQRPEDQQVGSTSGPFEYRAPIDLSNPRLRNLAKALAPAYMRVSGSWQNSTYFQDDDNPALKNPPGGFKGVLTRSEWKSVLDFVRMTNGALVTSFAVSPGTRDASGTWTPTQAKALLDYTRSMGGSIAATEFMNEPTFPVQGGAPAGYDANAYANDVKAFNAFLRKESPRTVFLGPGSVGEGVSLGPAGMKIKLLDTDALLKVTPPVFDAFSYHFYGAVSRRCMGATNINDALSPEWLDRTDRVEEFYAALRDKYLPGKRLWLTETGEAACGGDPFAAQFADTFRFINQLGSLAQKDVQVVMHNTLAASDYGLLNQTTLEPTPNYWAAVLWKRTMGSVVLDPAPDRDQALRVYAHCMPGGNGGVTLVALNTDHQERTIQTPESGNRFTLTATDLASSRVMMNQAELKAQADGTVPTLTGEASKAGSIALPPLSITFVSYPTAHNSACKQE